MADVRQLSEDAAKLAAAPLWPLADDELTVGLKAAHRLEQCAAALQARLVQQAVTRGVPSAQGHRSTAGWLRALLLLDPQPARELAGQAAALSRHPAVEQAVLDGHLNLRQSTVIAETLDALPDDLVHHVDGHGGDGNGEGHGRHPDSAEVSRLTELAQTTMIGMAGRLPAYQLRRVGERILAHVAPEIAERADEAALARQEARAHERRGLTLSLPVDGLVRISGLLGAEDATIVQAALHPLCTPAPGDDRTAAHRRADALIDICRLALRTSELPSDGGEPPQLAVTVAYDPLTRTLSTGTTDTGRRLSAGTIRRLACDARILPFVLGGAGQILDTGRARRLATGPLRRALHIRDQGCAFPDCDRPPRWTDAHHLTAWTNGGPTTLNNLVLLCRHHHRLIHHPGGGWQIRLGPDQHPDFYPPPSIDPLRRPRRNLYHRRRAHPERSQAAADGIERDR
ncbi:HNH endonuclease signature motif containing protein [Actinoplanes sp. M2I2]|uniref:HNH endonuclease signature motif containing protein n=1 Tax=Actinoplanes sp. M2I2 TaxID=1734444 RepID=UPI0020202590|nr:HNH endonuclease signature motif containing protein [Actinoplanes sp. M2I2]